jgi:GH15 family glucan-1,4-alpha-glucosidase
MRSGGADHPDHQLVRIVSGVTGTVTFDVELRPRFDYGLTVPLFRRRRGDMFTAVGGSEAFVIHTDVELDVDRDEGQLTGQFVLNAGDTRRMMISSRWAHQVDDVGTSLGDADDHLQATIAWWRRWSSTLLTPGPHGAHSRRSAIVLKGLTCAPTGAVIAAATTSLPEEMGGSRNWDYRYSWVRDSSLVIEALADSGHEEVAKGFSSFLLRSAAGNAKDLQIMYGAYGERRLTEMELDLEGWNGSRPVRIGNDAATQTQLDVYGHLLDAVDAWHDGTSAFEPSEREFLRDAVDLAAQRWHEPDQGIWEMRGDPRHFVHSKVMCWVALDRGIGLAELLHVGDEQLEGWHRSAGAIRHDVMTRGIDPVRGCFRQHYDTDDVDASLLKLSLVGFVGSKDPTMLATVAAIQHDLSVGESGFVRRYPHHVDDGVGAPGRNDEGVFLVASCWLIENLRLQGRTDEAVALLERLLASSNDLGLHAEEFDVRSGRMMGNFPQAFTHLGLIVAAKRLSDGDAPVRRTRLRP